MRGLLLLLAVFCALVTWAAIGYSIGGAPIWVPVIWGLVAVVFWLIATRLPEP